MKKVVINRCYGGFGLSKEAYLRYAELKGIKVWIEDVDLNLGIFTVWTIPPEQQPNIKDKNYLNVKRDKTLYYRDMERDDPVLVQVVELLGKKANDEYANLKIVEIPDDVGWEIDVYDGMEEIHETHRTWC